jgi:MoxR-like ATPase
MEEFIFISHLGKDKALERWEREVTDEEWEEILSASHPHWEMIYKDEDPRPYYKMTEIRRADGSVLRASIGGKMPEWMAKDYEEVAQLMREGDTEGLVARGAASRKKRAALAAKEASSL